MTSWDGPRFNPSKKLVVGCYDDAIFPGLWLHENPQDPIYVIIRTIFVVTFSSCPLFQVSKTQTEIALSTLHSECVELSHSVRDSRLLKILIKEVIDGLGINSEKLEFVSISTVYEDNNIDIVVAKISIMNPTSNHIAFKYYWCMQHVGD